MINMALRKDGNSRSSASYKPYDPSNSFVKKMTNTVTGLFNWRSLQSESQHFNDVLNSNSDDDRIAPASKRMKVQNDDEVQFQSISNTGRGLQDTCSPIKPINDIHAAGPSNRNKCIISSTPATTFQRSPVFFNTIDQSSSKRVTQNAEDSEAADISTSLPQFSVHQRHNITVPSLPKDVPNMMSTIDASKSLSGSFSSTNSRRPSFNVDVFSASSRRLSLSVCEGRNRNCLSPFYSARTMYGGASALLPYGSQTANRMRSASTSKLDVFSPRSQITMQPVPSPSKLNDQEILSASARRILDSLEKYCSPVSDAKRIPMSESSRKSVNSSPQHSLSRGVKRKLPTLNQMLPSTSELLRIKRTERMQDSVSSAKQTVSAVPESSIAAEDSDSSSDSAELDYSVLSQESKDTGAQSGGKVTRKNESKFDDRPKPVNLPNAVLKISNLPKFNVTDEFVFSKPLLLENLDDKVDESSSDTAVSKNNKSTQSPTASTAPPASPSTSSSFSKDANKSNVTQTFTAAFLKTAKPVLKLSPTPKTTDNQSPSKFSLSNDTACSPKGSSSGSPKASWTCMNCLTKNSADECSKCSRQRQQKAEPVAPAKVVEAEKSEEPKAPSWGDKFKPPADTWECPECLVRNKNACVECAACGKAKNNVAKSGATATPSSSVGFDWQNLKKPTGWSCGTCCVQNKETDTQCAACEQPKEPSKGEATASKEPPKPQFSFGIDKSGVASTSGAVKFGTPDKPAGSITFGIPSVSAAASTATFTFGVKSSQPATTSATTNGETTSVTTAAAVPTFTFGLPKSTAPETNANISPAVKNPLLSTPLFGSFGEKSADKKESPSVVNDVSGVTMTNPLLANDSSIFKTPKFAAPKPVAVSPKENGEESGHNSATNLFNDTGSETPKKKVALFSSVLKSEPSNGLTTKNTATVSNGGPNVSNSGNTFVTSLATSAFTPAPAKLTNDTQLSLGAAATATPKTDGPVFGDKSGMKMFGSQTNSFGSMATTSASTTPLLFGNSMMSTNVLGSTTAVKSTDTPQLGSVGGGASAATFPAAMPPAFAFGTNSSTPAAAPTSLKSSEMSLSGNPAAPNFTSAAAAQPPFFSFGGNVVSAAPAAAAAIPAGGAFMFNGPKADDGAASKFRFGATNPTPFGSTAAVGATAAAPSFTFGSTPSVLNAANTDQNERPATNTLFGNAATLNRAPETPAVNANSISSFGGANVFGNAVSQPANPAKKSGGFSFNAQSPFTAPAVNNFPSFASPAVNQEPKPAAPTFVFGSNNQTPQTHNFNQTVPSTFNFSGGNNQLMSFSAPPVPPSAAPNACGPTRKIKKAVRRTTPK